MDYVRKPLIQKKKKRNKKTMIYFLENILIEYSMSVLVKRYQT